MHYSHPGAHRRQQGSKGFVGRTIGEFNIEDVHAINNVLSLNNHIDFILVLEPVIQDTRRAFY